MKIISERRTVRCELTKDEDIMDIIKEEAKKGWISTSFTLESKIQFTRDIYQVDYKRENNG